jgi:2-dehydro-3-deoxyphosphogluconate aldolase/(4S)-4-hydroxy-2-oxoglutarate aldolase
MNFADILWQKRLILIIRGIQNEEQLKSSLEAVYEGGIRLAEITYDSTGTRSDETTAAWIKTAVEQMSGRMLIGAGTVLTPKQAELTEQAGGAFIISPNMDTEVIAKTKQLGLVSIPAAMTVSEIVCADRAGADYIKVFPTSVIGGCDFFRAVAGPLPSIKLLAVSGISLEEVGDYLRAGAYGFGIGSAIVNGALCRDGNYAQIEQNARLFAQACERK